MGMPDVARKLVTSKNTALSTMRLQPGSFTRPGSYSYTRTNARERRIAASFLSANVATLFFHGLGFVPSGFTPLAPNAACRIYNDLPFQATSRVIVLKCDTANVTVDILVR